MAEQNVLLFEKRGCNFRPGEHQGSDIGNYCICTTDYIACADGRRMFFEFTRTDRHQFRNTNKRTGAPLKKPVYELVARDIAGINTCYERDNLFFRDLEIERRFFNALVPYTKTAILNFINTVAAQKYTAIEFV